MASKTIINLISVLATWTAPYVESSLVLLEKGVSVMATAALGHWISERLRGDTPVNGQRNPNKIVGTERGQTD